jgi:hypothetical protein
MLGASLQIAGAGVSERAELAFLGSSLLISGTTVVASCLRRGTRAAVWGTFVAGAGLLVAARSGIARAEPLEPLLVIGGAGMIVGAHVISLCSCRCRKEGSSCVGTG